ncbi:type II toxin-antitoxin system toxin DNA ADP-ribosyl transferase DarT [Paramagnetospirillum caucaseum]|nr:DUF4433 domain-containing protein [Paramagnetospirillum caucaseum]
MPVPASPKIYHIVNVDKLPSIIGDGALWSDAKMAVHAPVGTVIGMQKIKNRRLHLPVHCRPGTHVGDYVPFYFCPRSVMLYVIHCGNNEGLAYQGGQEPIIHLEADLHEVVAWADGANVPWAFSLSNAAEVYAEFRHDLVQLNEVNWLAVDTRRWGGPNVAPEIRSSKQAEFLVYDAFPWNLVRRIGVCSRQVAMQASEVLREAAHRPGVEIKPDWYY